jgi:hypothetical protein
LLISQKRIQLQPCQMVAEEWISKKILKRIRTREKSRVLFLFVLK